MQDNLFAKRLLDNLNTAILLVDAALIVRYLNPAAEALLAISSARATGAPLVDCFNEVDGHDTATALRETLQSAHSFTRREARLRIPAQEIIVDYSVTLLMSPGEPTSLLIEMQQIDRLLRISKEEGLLSNHHAARTLVRGIAHEIKNPLGGIRGAAQLLAKTLPDPALAEYTNIIIGEADRLRNLADRMLGPRHLPKIRAVNIHECLERVRSLILVEAKNHIRVLRDYDISLPELNVDSDQIIQVILNIAGNALQALTENADQANPSITFRTRHLRQVTIGTIRHRLVINVEIIDNGPGIPPALLETIFYPMVSGRANGTGLGLSIAQDIVHQYQGLIECTSGHGHTTFSILLPVEQGNDSTK
jgi:two-component system nitrogen regulation sensor histidine kinase GlnL